MKFNKAKLGEFAIFRNGMNFGKEDYGKGIKYVGVPDFWNKFIPDYDTLREISTELTTNEDLLCEGDVVFVRSNGNKDLVGRSMLIKNLSIPLTYSGFCIRARITKANLNATFFAYYAQSELFRKSLSNPCAGTNISNLNQDLLKNAYIPLPPLPIQRRIADILSAYDDLIENNRKQIALLEEAAQRLYREWFVDFRFPGHETAEWENGLPKGWTQESISDFTEVIMGQSPKSEFFNNTQEGLPFHQGVGYYGDRFVCDAVYSTKYTRIAESNSILFSVRAPVGRLNITKNKVVIGRGLAAMRHKKGFNSFLFYMLKKHFFKDDIVGNGSIFASISRDELLDLRFVIPEYELIRKFEKTVSVIDSQINILDDNVQKAQIARDSLLPRLMSGELEVCHA